VSETLNPAESTPSVDSTIQTPEPIAAPAPEATPVQATESAPPPADAKEQTQAPSASGDKDANKKATLLDVVKAAYEKKSLPDPISSTGGHTDPAKGNTNDAKASLDDGKTQPEGADKAAEKLPFHNHPRWKEMLSEREALKPRAEQYDKIVSFMNTNSLTPNEMADGMRVMALMKHNPAAAYEQLQTYIKKLAPFTGEELHPEIKAKVDEGFVDPDTAKELSRLKAEKEFLNQRSEEIYQQHIEQQQAASQKAMYDAVVGWEASEKARDPDWAAKYEMIQDRVRSLMTTTKPSNPEEAVQLARRALSDVNDRLRPLAGRNTAMRTPISSMSSATTRPVARSLEDIVRMGLQT
jgi:hypothetical protein